MIKTLLSEFRNSDRLYQAWDDLLKLLTQNKGRVDLTLKNPNRNLKLVLDALLGPILNSLTEDKKCHLVVFNPDDSDFGKIIALWLEIPCFNSEKLIQKGLRVVQTISVLDLNLDLSQNGLILPNSVPLVVVATIAFKTLYQPTQTTQTDPDKAIVTDSGLNSPILTIFPVLPS